MKVKNHLFLKYTIWLLELIKKKNKLVNASSALHVSVKNVNKVKMWMAILRWTYSNFTANLFHDLLINAFILNDWVRLFAPD